MIYEVTMYAAKCDNCGNPFFTKHSEYSALSDADSVRYQMQEADWHIEADKHYCPDCFEVDDDDNIVIKLKPTNP